MKPHRLLFLVALTVAALGTVGPAAAQETASIATDDQFLPGGDGWQTYVNGRFGFHLDFPADIFAPQPPPERSDGRTFLSSDATLQAFAFPNTEGDTPASLREELVGGEGYANVTYSPSGGSWLVLSGFRGDTIYYEKYFFRDGVISAFGMEFPAERKPFYAPIIESIENSFRAGG